MMTSVRTSTLVMSSPFSSVAARAGRAGQLGQEVGPARAVQLARRRREPGVAEGQDRVAVVLGQRDRDRGRTRGYRRGTLGRLPAQREDDAPVRDQLDK